MKISKHTTLSAILITTVLLCSCASSKKVSYFKNIDDIDLTASKGLYDATIMPKDMLSITVSTLNYDAARPFNIAGTVTQSLSGMTQSQTKMEGYLVDNDGNINFPVIGKIHVAGLTKTRCQDLIRDKVLPYMSASENPVVTVTMSSYRITVTGEVNSPGVIPVTVEKMSLVEALAQAGDLTIYGKRDNIMLIRESSSGQKSVYRIDLTDADLFNSPLYYVQQNDIIYVEPNRAKRRSASVSSTTSLWFSCISMMTSITSLIINIVRN